MKNNVALAVFTKTPGISPVKTRLSKITGKNFALNLHELNCKAIEQTLLEINKDVDPYWAVAEKEALDLNRWNQFKTLCQEKGELGERLHHIYQQLRSKYESIIFIGSDSPQISPGLIIRSIELLQTHDFVLGPATDGGYYLFAGKKDLSQSLWNSIPYSHEQTFKIFYEKLLKDGSIGILPKLTDIDEVQDFNNVLTEMKGLEKLNYRQKEIENLLSRYLKDHKEHEALNQHTLQENFYSSVFVSSTDSSSSSSSIS